MNNPLFYYSNSKTSTPLPTKKRKHSDRMENESDNEMPDKKRVLQLIERNEKLKHEILLIKKVYWEEKLSNNLSTK